MMTVSLQLSLSLKDGPHCTTPTCFFAGLIHLGAVRLYRDTGRAECDKLPTTKPTAAQTDRKYTVPTLLALLFGRGRWCLLNISLQCYVCVQFSGPHLHSHDSPPASAPLCDEAYGAIDLVPDEIPRFSRREKGL